MPIPVSSRRAYITITIGTLLLSGAFLVLSIDYANTTGVFYTERNTPIIHFTNELEALTSLLYSLPEDAHVEYRGPYACEWSERSGNFVCEGGLEVEEVSAAVSFTKDERMLYTPRTACIYMSIGAVQAILGKAKKANVLDDAGELGNLAKKELAEEFGQQAAQKGKKEAKNRLARWIDSIQTSKNNFAKRMKRRLGSLRGLDPDDLVLTKKFGYTKHELREKVLKGIQDGDISYTRSKFFKSHFDTPEEFADSIVDYMAKNPEAAMGRNIMDAVNGVAGARKKAYGNVYYHLKKSEEIREDLVQRITDDIREELGRGWFEGDDFEDWAALYPDDAALYTYVVDGQRYIKDVPTIMTDRALFIRDIPKIDYYRDPILWAQATASGYAAYRSCRSNDPLWELVDLLTGNQILFQVDLDSVDSFYDFYAGKYGAVTIDFTDGADDITAVKSYGTNGEDMCFLRNQLSFFGGD
jgi:hypothetical protein